MDGGGWVGRRGKKKGRRQQAGKEWARNRAMEKAGNGKHFHTRQWEHQQQRYMASERACGEAERGELRRRNGSEEGGRCLFIGPESDHWECLSLTDSLTH